MTAPLKDEDIIALYKESATESPSKDLDDRILAYAEEATRNTKASSKFAWLSAPWQTYAGVAAIVGFVALLAPWEWTEDTLHSPHSIEPMNAPAIMSSDAVSGSDAQNKALSGAEAVQSLEALPPPPKEQHLNRKAPSLMRSAPQTEEVTSEFAAVEKLLDEGNKAEAIELLEKILVQDPELLYRVPERLRALMVNPDK